ncbi:MAG: ABC transporter substrate-binding protein [Candidatus Caldarchaeum sp.]
MSDRKYSNKISRRKFLGVSTSMAVGGAVGGLVVGGLAGYFAGGGGQQAGARTVFQTVTGPGRTETLTRTVTAGQATQERTLKIAEIGGLSGGIAPYGIPLHNSRLMAVEEINAAGGVVIGNTRYKLELVYVDGARRDDAIAALERFVEQEKLQFILDGASSSNYYALGPIIKEKHPKALVIAAGGYDPGTVKGIPNFFRSTFDISDLFELEIRWLRQKGVRRLAVLIDKNHADAILYVEKLLPPAGFEIVADERYTSGQADFVPILTKLRGMSFDALIWHGFEPDHVNIIKQARTVGLLPPKGQAPNYIWLSQSLAEPDFGGPLMGGDVSFYEGLYVDLFGTAADLPNATPRIRYLRDAYKKKFPDSVYVSWVSTGYDSVYILVRALQKAGTVDDVPKVIDALHKLTIWDVPELTFNYPPGLIFDREGQAHPIITMGLWENNSFRYITSTWEDARHVHDPVKI